MIILEGNDLKILEFNTEKKYLEVVDGDTLFKGEIYEMTCENEFEYGYRTTKHQKIVMYKYTAEPLEKGYIAKKKIKQAIENIYINNDDMLYLDMDENVDVIYDELEKEGLLK